MAKILRQRDELAALIPDTILMADYMEIQAARAEIVRKVMEAMKFNPVDFADDKYMSLTKHNTFVLFRRNFLAVGISRDGRWPEKFRTYSLEVGKSYGLWLADLLTEEGYSFPLQELIRLKRFYRHNYDLAPDFILDGIGPLDFDKYQEWLNHYSPVEEDDYMLAFATRLGFKPRKPQTT